MTMISHAGDHAELSPGQVPAGDLKPKLLRGGDTSDDPAGGCDTEPEVFRHLATAADTTFRPMEEVG